MDCKGGTSISRKCKKYEDSGCYTAANWHQEKEKELEEDVRGCSSFVENEVHKVFRCLDKPKLNFKIKFRISISKYYSGMLPGSSRSRESMGRGC